MKYTKINALYKRCEFSKEACPEKKWLALRNKIGDFSDSWAEYTKDLKFDCFSKIDGTNTRIIWYPGKKELIFSEKTSDSDPNQFGLQDFFKPLYDKLFNICAQGWWYPISMLFQYAGSLGFQVATYLGPLSIMEVEDKVKAGFKTLVPGVKNPEFLEEEIVARPIIPLFDSRKNIR